MDEKTQAFEADIPFIRQVDYEKAMTLRRVKAWLKEKAPDEVVGRSGTVDHCPLATYLRGTGLWEPGVSDHSVILMGDLDAETHMLPTWAREFVRYIDHKRRRGRKVTAKEAMEVMAQVESRERRRKKTTKEVQKFRASLSPEALAELDAMVESLIRASRKTVEIDA